MSMSQEEIEALMNGLDIVDDEDSAVQEESSIVLEDAPVVNTDEIEELISQNEKVSVEKVSTEPEKIETLSNEISSETDDNSVTINNDDIDALLKDLELSEPKEEEPSDTLDELNNLGVEPLANNDLTTQSFDDISADEEGIVESTTAKTLDEEKTVDNKDEIGKDWADSKINEGMFPFPADSDTKVVNQLSQVANDSEEKVSQIFDVLSLTLDNNNDIRGKLDEFDKYIASNLELLTSLSVKFPNIEIFNAQKKAAETMSNNIKEISDIVNTEDMKIFEAMELMQFNDINRQKIERVMAVIRKLSLYLNNLFEDDGTSEEIAVAKHIHGDTNHDLIGEDLDKLIDEFAK
ncbi:MAG: hypothetical protein CL623_09835 [Arcobacter sp.]|nr:hypothetical protein [Arcobacter sp.]